VNWMATCATNYQIVLVGDVIAALAFLAFGLDRFVGPRAAGGGVVLLRFLFFGLLEYAVHRWVLHGPPSLAGSVMRAELTALIATPFFIVVITALVIWTLLRLVRSEGLPALLVFGLYAGTTTAPFCTTGNTTTAPMPAARTGANSTLCTTSIINGRASTSASARRCGTACLAHFSQPAGRRSTVRSTGLASVNERRIETHVKSGCPSRW
jgi:hypothetical protein